MLATDIDARSDSGAPAAREGMIHVPGGMFGLAPAGAYIGQWLANFRHA